jgi:hypothetical protein
LGVGVKYIMSQHLRFLSDDRYGVGVTEIMYCLMVLFFGADGISDVLF